MRLPAIVVVGNTYLRHVRIPIDERVLTAPPRPDARATQCQG